MQFSLMSCMNSFVPYDIFVFLYVLYNLIWNCETLLQLFPIFNRFSFLLALQKPQCFSCNAATLLVG